ncbi:MAG: cobalamin biosynthesis protein, partial [Candidatus Freyarchaeota archaeon]
MNSPLFIDRLTILLLAVLVDLIFGEPPDRLHPTVWMGRTISLLEEKIRNENPRIERINGALMALSVIMLFSLPVYFMLFLVRVHFGRIAYIVVGALLLKPTFAIKCMRECTL